MTIKTWTNHVGTFAAHPVTGAHYGPFVDSTEATCAMGQLVENGKDERPFVRFIDRRDADGFIDQESAHGD